MDYCARLEEYHKIVEGTCKEQEITNYIIKFIGGPTKGEGYTSKMYRISIAGEKKNGKNTELQIILKIAPNGKQFRKQFKSEVPFRREWFIYETVLPAFQKLQQKLDIPLRDQFKNYCKFYGGSLKHLEEIIIMENMKALGFQLWDRSVTMTYDMVKLAVQTLGRFNALSFALRDKNPQAYQQIADSTPDLKVRLYEESNYSTYLATLMEKSKAALDPIEDRVALKKYERLQKNSWKTWTNIIEETNVGPYSVIGHGDIWCNNMMFKFDVRYNALIN